MSVEKSPPPKGGGTQTTRPSKEGSSVTSRFDLDKYNAVIEVAELGEVALASCNFDLKVAYFRAKNKEEDGVKYTYQCDVSDLHFLEEHGVVGATFSWSLRAREGRKVLAKIDTSYICYYTRLQDCEEASAKAFLGRVGRFTTYPYFRALVSQMSWASGAQFPILPVLKEAKDTVPKRAKQSKGKSSSRKTRKAT